MKYFNKRQAELNGICTIDASNKVGVTFRHVCIVYVCVAGGGRREQVWR